MTDVIHDHDWISRVRATIRPWDRLSVGASVRNCKSSRLLVGRRRWAREAHAEREKLDFQREMKAGLLGGGKDGTARAGVRVSFRVVVRIKVRVRKSQLLGQGHPEDFHEQVRFNDL